MNRFAHAAVALTLSSIFLLCSVGHATLLMPMGHMAHNNMPEHSSAQTYQDHFAHMTNAPQVFELVLLLLLMLSVVTCGTQLPLRTAVPRRRPNVEPPSLFTSCKRWLLRMFHSPPVVVA